MSTGQILSMGPSGSIHSLGTIHVPIAALKTEMIMLAQSAAAGLQDQGTGAPSISGTTEDNRWPQDDPIKVAGHLEPRHPGSCFEKMLSAAHDVHGWRRGG